MVNQVSDDYEYIDLPIFCGPLVSREVGKGIQSVYFNLTFNDSSNNHSNQPATFAILFQNYYTASISVSLVENKDTSNSNFQETVILESKQLMESPFCEKSANDWFTIEVSEFNSNYIDKHALRFHLYQPSSMWNSCDIRNIKVIGRILKPRNTNKLSILNNRVSNADDCFSQLLKNNMKSIQLQGAKRDSLKIK